MTLRERRRSTVSSTPEESQRTGDIASQIEQNAETPVEPQQKVEDILGDVIANIEKAFGKGSIMPLESRGAVFADWPVIPSGLISLDRALGIWGWPKGRIIEIYGPEASGKTTLSLHAIAESQKQGGFCAFVDAEHALDPQYAKRLGVDTRSLLISQPDSGEQSLEIAEKLISSRKLSLVVIDSVSALVPQAEIDGEMGQTHVGLQARLMSQALRKLTGIISKTKTALIFINQIRHKIGVMFGSPETTSGGNALKFYASVRIDVRRLAALKDGNEVIGNRTRIKVIKNKLAPPLKETEVDIMYGYGFSRYADILDVGAQIGIIERNGAWYSYEGERIGNGREQTKKFLEENKQLCDEIGTKVFECLVKERK